jgi:hypothetical protein
LKINPPDLLMMKRWRNTILSMQAGDNFLREIVLLLQSSIILLCCCHYLSFKISYCIYCTVTTLLQYYQSIMVLPYRYQQQVWYWYLLLVLLVLWYLLVLTNRGYPYYE